MEVKEKMEKGRIVGPSTTGSLSVTGEPYCLFHFAPHHNKEQAEAALLRAFNAYQRGKGTFLYWRILPEITRHEDRIAKECNGWAGLGRGGRPMPASCVQIAHRPNEELSHDFANDGYGICDGGR